MNNQQNENKDLIQKQKIKKNQNKLNKCKTKKINFIG